MAPLKDIAAFHPLAVLSCLVIAGFVLKRLYYELTTGSRRRAMIREHGCKPVVWYEHQGILGKLFGVDVMKALLGSAKRGSLHQESRIRNFTGRNTVMFRILRSKFIMTIEYVQGSGASNAADHKIRPEIIKTILSTKFNDYSLGQRRKDTFIPVLGHGIFDSDGAAWERSRAL